MNSRIIRAILVVLLQCDGQPIPEFALVQAAQMLCRSDNPTEDDVRERLREVEAQQFISGATDPLTKERTWTLTTKGIHKARQLR
ncbi:MAG TPA: hypothetical protein VGI03_15200 [Verrucomicrobiae bacterium]|jgi:hypothetical protein